MKPCLFWYFSPQEFVQRLLAGLTYCTTCWPQAGTRVIQAFFVLGHFEAIICRQASNVDVWAWLYSVLFNLLFEVESLLKTLHLLLLVGSYRHGLIQSQYTWHIQWDSSLVQVLPLSYPLLHQPASVTLSPPPFLFECTLFSFRGEKQEGALRQSDAQLHTQCRLMEGRRVWAQAGSDWLASDVQLLRSTTCHC